MSQEINDVIPFLVRVLNDMYKNVKDIENPMNEMNKTIETFSHTITDSMVTISSDLTGIIQIVRASRETIFNKITNSINELNDEFTIFKSTMTSTTKSSKGIFDKLQTAKINLQNKMQDAEFLSLILELKDILNKINEKLD